MDSRFNLYRSKVNGRLPREVAHRGAAKLVNELDDRPLGLLAVIEIREKNLNGLLVVFFAFIGLDRQEDLREANYRSQMDLDAPDWRKGQ